MNIRRRLALWLDPSLTSEPAPTFDFGRHGHLVDLSSSAARIARSLESIDRKTVKRRPRNVWCQHPELHPEIER